MRMLASIEQSCAAGMSLDENSWDVGRAGSGN